MGFVSSESSVSRRRVIVGFPYIPTKKGGRDGSGRAGRINPHLNNNNNNNNNINIIHKNNSNLIKV